MLLLILLMLAPQAEADRLFALGNALMSEGDLHGAAAAYEGALGTGWTSPELELNLGSAYFEAGHLGRAVLHFERAQRLAPRHAAVQHNLQRARVRLGVIPASPAPDAAVALWLSNYVGAGGITGVLFALYLATLGLLGLRLWKREPQPWLRRSLLVLVPLTVLVAAAAVLTAQVETASRAVVLAETDVRSTPSGTGATLDEVPEGLVLPVTEQRGLWRAVRLPDGEQGWIEASALEEI